ncbi:putative kinase [Escherichia coli]|uniref:Putative kinase n=1 Tax=Escherichia coli TaxID=562 RepID=A0A376LN21_ECOLX|nr:putative kinase [Escherichia coli]
MWQAISRLLSEQLGEGEIELRNELPWRRSPCRMAFALCRT